MNLGRSLRPFATLLALGLAGCSAFASTPEPTPQAGPQRPAAARPGPQNGPAAYSSVITGEAISDEGVFRFDRRQEVGRLPLPQDLPLALRDDTPVGVESLLSVVTEGTLDALQVQVAIEHSWVGDLELRLTSPAGTTVQLLDRPGVPANTFGCSRDDMDILFSDTAEQPLEDLCAGNPWFVGTALPRQSLTAFAGEGLAGTWRLTVVDHAPGDAGQLLTWRLITDPGLEGQCNPCNDRGQLITVLDIPTLGHWAARAMALLLALLAAQRLAGQRLASQRPERKP